MGNTPSNIKLTSIMRHLDKLEHQGKRNRSVTVSTLENTPYKLVVRVGDSDDDIIQNINIPDAGFKSVMLTIGTQIFIGKLEADLRWYFREPIPLFKIPTEKCYLTIYTLTDIPATPINLNYDSYAAVPDKLKNYCHTAPLVSGNLVYNDGCVY